MIAIVKILNWRGMLAATLLCSPMLNACAERKAPAPAPAANRVIPVSIHGVNHTAEPVSFILTDPANEENRGGGEIVNSFSSGGSMCCYALPATWRPGIKIKVAEKYWLPEKADNTIPEVKKEHVLEVPRYADGKVGELWVTRGPGGEISIVSTNLEPDHPDYPGAIKGWPVPDLAHQRTIQDMYIRDAEESVALCKRMLAALNKNPAAHAKEIWEFKMDHSADSLKSFSGPTDSEFLVMLRKRYTEELALSEKQLKNMKAARP